MSHSLLNSSRQEVDRMNSEIVKGDTAYAKLVCENGKEFYMKELECEIGREAKLSSPKYFCIAETNTISKNHAKIFWDQA